MTRPEINAAVLGVTMTVAPTFELGAHASECASVPVMVAGRVAREVCPEDVDAQQLTIVSLSDRWAPRIFSETPDAPQPYRAVVLALASEQLGEGRAWTMPSEDRYFELYGIFPDVSVVRRRLLDGERHACHARIDDAALRLLHRTVAPWDASIKPKPSMTAAFRSCSSTSRVKGLCVAPSDQGSSTPRRARGLSAAPHVAVGRRPGRRDAHRVSHGQSGARLSLLRVLRERVVDATGLIEDGSALNAWEPVLGRSSIPRSIATSCGRNRWRQAHRTWSIARRRPLRRRSDGLHPRRR